MRGGAGNVDRTGHALGLADVDRLEFGQLVGVFLDQAGQAMDDPLARHRRHVAPAAVVEGGAGGGNGTVDILVGRFDEPRDDLARGRVFDIDRFPARGIDPFAIDVELRLAFERLLDGSRIFPLRAVDGGDFIHGVMFLSRNDSVGLQSSKWARACRIGSAAGQAWRSEFSRRGRGPRWRAGSGNGGSPRRPPRSARRRRRPCRYGQRPRRSRLPSSRPAG